MTDDDMMVTAGLWDEWASPKGERIRSCTIITTETNDTLSVIHERMPVILAHADWPKWLGEETATDAELRALLAPCPNDRVKAWPVSKRVGDVRNNSPDLADARMVLI